MRVRDASIDDVPSITAIFNELIGSRTVTWSETEDSVEDRIRWLARMNAAGHPVLVAVDDTDAGNVLGFASYGEFRNNERWPGYRFTVELSIHVDEAHWGRGVGRALMTELLDRARLAGMHVMVAAVDGENHESIAFHERMGFVTVGRLHQTGFKFGRWLDLVFMQIVLDDQRR